MFKLIELLISLRFLLRLKTSSGSETLRPDPKKVSYPWGSGSLTLTVGLKRKFSFSHFRENFQTKIYKNNENFRENFREFSQKMRKCSVFREIIHFLANH
jgi:hypothetical protein